MAADDDELANEVVKIVPDLSGFRKKLDKDLAKAMKPQPVAHVQLLADRSKLGASIKAKVAEQAALSRQPTYKVQLVASGAGFLTSVRTELKRITKTGRQPTYKVKVTADAKVDRGSVRKAAQQAADDVDGAFKRIEGSSRVLADSINKRLARNLQESFLLPKASEPLTRALTRAQSERAVIDRAEDQARAQRAVKRQRDDETYLNFQQRVSAELASIERGRADDEIGIRHDTQNRVAAIEREGARLRLALLAVEERAEKEALRRSAAAQREAAVRRSAITRSLTSSPQLIDWGGRGVRPMHALYAAAVALSPALLAVGASALQASTSVAALGAAGIGAALGLTGVLTAFQGIGDALKLRKTVQNEALTKAANAGQKAATVEKRISDARRRTADRARRIAGVEERLAQNLDDQIQARRGLADAQRDYATAQRNELSAFADIHTARREAVRDLQDLRQSVVELNNQYRNDTLSVAEAKEREGQVNRNFFATALERRRAHQDTLNAQVRLAGTGLDRKQRREDLRESLRKGIEGSDKVRDAKERARAAREGTRDARDRVLDARNALKKKGVQRNALTRGLAGAQEAASAAAADSTAAINTTSSAAAQLRQKLAEMAPAARDMYTWFVKNEDVFKRLQRQIAQAVLPGFTTFLKAISTRPKGGGKTTLQLAADYAGKLGGIISKYAGKFGVFTKSPLFRGSMARIQGQNVKAFEALGRAALVLARPLLRIVDKASPGFVSMAEGVERLAIRFDKWIEKLDKNGSLAKWFKDARTEAGKWLKIGGDIFTLLKNLFQGSRPAGGSLVDKFGKLTDTVAKWSESPEGQKQIKDFFDKIASLPFAKIADLFKNTTILFLAFRTLKFAKDLNPLILAFTAFATANPGLAAEAIGVLAEKLNGVMQFIVDHPDAAASIIAILAAAKLGKSIGFDIKIPAVKGIRDALTSKFAVLDKFVGGGASTATMVVHAGVVNIVSKVPGAPVPGAPGKPGKPGAATASSLAVSGAITAAGVFGASLVVDQILGPGEGWAGLKALVMGPDAYSEWSKKNAPGFRRFFTMTLPGWLTSGGERGWSSFKDAFINDFGAPAAHWFSVTLPNALNLGVGQGGWAGLANNLGTWFSHTLPDALNLGEGTGWAALGGNLRRWFSTTLPDAMSGRSGGWSGFGTYVKDTLKEQLGINAVVGTWNGIVEKTVWLWEKVSGWVKDFIDWVKKLLGIDSPSTVFAGIGADLVAGLWQGFIEKWINLLPDALTWIGQNFTVPLVSAFTGAGGAITGAFTSVFGTLTAKLAEPVSKVFGWLNDNFIGKINELLGKIAAPLIPLLVDTVSRPAGAAAGRAAKDVGRIIRRAGGGRIQGFSPHPRADNIPALLTAEEYVQPVDAVRHYGVGFMEAVRTKRFPRFAEGGLAGGGLTRALGDNLLTRIAEAAMQRAGGIQEAADRIIASTLTGGVASGDVKVAETAEATARAMGATEKQLVALIAAGLVESGLHNLNYGDRDSLGFLQQRASWGSVAARMDVATATRKFINKAKRVDNARLSAGQLAQAVQISAFPEKYPAREADAVAVLNRAAPFLTGYGGMGGGGGSRANLIAFGRWLQERGYDVSEHPAFGGVRGRHMDNSQHYRANAIDVNRGAGTSAKEQAYLRQILPEARRRGLRAIFMVRGHYDHAHFDLGPGHAAGGLVRRYDDGGMLPPGYSIAFNGTGQNETVRTARQEAELGLPDHTMRIDRRDIALLAAHIAGAAGTPAVNLDGRRVAEVTNRYNYLPAGV